MSLTLTCSVCGATFERYAGEVKRSTRLGRPIYCSRSCSGKANLKNIPLDRRDPELHLRNGKPLDEYSMFRTAYRLARRRAEQMEWEFTITLADLKDVWDRQRGLCIYTGVEMRMPEKSLNSGYLEESMWNGSIDRIDSAKGYVPENIQFVCVMANYAKRHHSHEQMIEFCRAIARHHGDCPDNAG